MPPSPKQPVSLESQQTQAQAEYKAALHLLDETKKEITRKRAVMLRLATEIRQRDEAEAERRRVKFENALDPKKALVIAPFKVTDADIAAVR